MTFLFGFWSRTDGNSMIRMLPFRRPHLLAASCKFSEAEAGSSAVENQSPTRPNSMAIAAWLLVIYFTYNSLMEGRVNILDTRLSHGISPFGVLPKTKHGHHGVEEHSVKTCFLPQQLCSAKRLACHHEAK
jgi:hypothetical protein